MEENTTIVFISIIGVYILYRKIIKGDDWFQKDGDEYDEFN